ncbi:MULTISPECIES: hypothetical protein [unclassified Frankia]|uniref:hypothetical protein n=1 Tax=unclassified Frankia TaxID=2632575 RepID=UPI002AD2E8C0|nr:MULTISPECIES: hypothetical protein [unclassified Frankia]
MPLNSLHYTIGPAIAVAATAVLVAVCRWVFAPNRPRGSHATATSHGDFGMLVPVATLRTSTEAARLRQLLGQHGIRSTSGAAPPGPIQVNADGNTRRHHLPGWHVMVFPEDSMRARAVVAGTERDWA